MLSLTAGKPIAHITTGKDKGQIIRLNAKVDDQDVDIDAKSLRLKRSKLMPMIDVEDRQVVYIAGPSGSGKSTYASALATTYKKIWPEREIYFFSRTAVEDDPAYKKLKPTQVMLDETIVTDPIDINEFEHGSLIIFDDCNTITNGAIRKSVLHIIKDILEVGRKMGLWIIITSHLINPSDRDFSRTVLNELHTLTFFPRSGSSYQIKYALQKYFGLNNKEVDKLLKIPSRWVTINRSYPTYVAYDKGVFLLDALDSLKI